MKKDKTVVISFPFSDHPHSHHEGADPGVQLDAEADEVCVEDAQPVLKKRQKPHYKQSYLRYSQYQQKKKRKTSEFEKFCTVPVPTYYTWADIVIFLQLS